MQKIPNQVHFSKNSVQNVGSNLYGKNEKQPPRKLTLFKNEASFLQTVINVLKMKVQFFRQALKCLKMCKKFLTQSLQKYFFFLK
jgi:hypothetical protein